MKSEKEKEMPDVIRDMDKFKKGWTGGLPETPCGYGSKVRATVQQRAAIETVIQFCEIKTIADIGAGDLNWIKHTNLQGAKYKGYDLIVRHPEVQQFDIVHEPAPQVDLLMCLWVLNHLPHEDARQALQNLRDSGSKWLMMTWEQRLPDFLDLDWKYQWNIRRRDDPAKGHCFMRLVELNP